MQLQNPTLIPVRRVRWLIYGLLLLGAVIVFSSRVFPRSDANGFDLNDPLVPRLEIYHGGPPRDGIPSIDKPHFVAAAEVSFLNSDDRVLGLVFDSTVRAYPIKILNYHEIVNDKINRHAVVISYCPLCGSGVAFRPQVVGGNITFGVSGLLYNNDMLLYDRGTESLWSQIMGTAISGKLKGKQLKRLVLTDTSWGQWRQQHPNTQVLSTQTGYHRDYDRHPYGAYDTNRAIYFPVSNTNARFHPKERVIGLTIGKRARAYPVSTLARQNHSRFYDEFVGQKLLIEYDAAGQTAVIYDARHQPLPTTNLFWFAWFAFHPETEVFTGANGN